MYSIIYHISQLNILCRLICLKLPAGATREFKSAASPWFSAHSEEHALSPFYHSLLLPTSVRYPWQGLAHQQFISVHHAAALHRGNALIVSHVNDSSLSRTARALFHTDLCIIHHHVFDPNTISPLVATLVSPSGPPNGRTAAHEQLHRSEARLSAPSSIPFSSTFKEPLDLVRYCRAGYRTVFACLRPHSASRPFDLHHIRLGHVTEQLESSEASVLGRDTYVTVISFIPY
ncbi:hypothetical protein DFP72DRAFT_855165 [Ephemerocybe angulata]|uniref:Uncharacterized protein n=1 Tax=Ephemerocybe angulata TaxID=980116 RepID=A0A8H6LZV3_9AGAR|nr:hypothetical protein DFP72DRAFT_855165 [Tulosesus angulatus]